MTQSRSELSDPAGGGLSIKEHLAASWCEWPNRPLLLAKNTLIKAAILYRPNCRQWKCKYCGPQRARLFMFIAGNGYSELKANGREVYFWTITSHEKIRTPLEGITRWRNNWPKLLRRIKRASGYVSYLQIPEQHKDGAYHVHLLTTANTSQRWLKDNARSCGFGYMAESEVVQRPGKAAYYVAKYLTKQSHQQQWPKYFRRVNMSRNWPRPDPLEKSEHWAVTLCNRERSVQAIKDVLEVQGWSVSAFTA